MYPTLSAQDVPRAIALRAAIGVPIGVTIGIVIELVVSALYGGDYVPGTPAFLATFANVHAAVAVERVVFALLGAVMGAVSVVFELEKFSLARATITHMMVVVVSLLGAAWYLRWVPAGWPLVGFIGVAAGVYGCIWAGMWVRIRAQIRQANRRLSDNPGTSGS